MRDEISLPEIVAYARQKRGISARGLSLEAGLSASYVSKVESGAMSPSFEAFCSIARVLQLTDEEILFIVKLYQEVK